MFDAAELIARTRSWLVDHHYLLPRERDIRRLAVAARRHREQALSKHIAAGAGDERHGWPAQLLAPSEPGGLTHLEWLRATPPGKAARSLEEQLDKIHFLKALGADRLVFPDLPLVGQKELNGTIDVVRGRELFAEQQCTFCHRGGLWTKTVLDFTPPPTLTDIFCERDVGAPLNLLLPGCATDPDLTVVNPNAGQFLARFLEDVGSFNRGVAGAGNELGNNIGGVEKSALVPECRHAHQPPRRCHTAEERLDVSTRSWLERVTVGTAPF